MIAITADGVREVEMQSDDSLRILPPTCYVDVYDATGALRESATYTPDAVARFLTMAPAGFQLSITVNPVTP